MHYTCCLVLLYRKGRTLYSLFCNFGGFPNPIVDIFCKLYFFPKIYPSLLDVHTKVFNTSLSAARPAHSVSGDGEAVSGAVSGVVSGTVSVDSAAGITGFFLRWREGFLGSGVPSQPPAAR